MTTTNNNNKKKTVGKYTYTLIIVIVVGRHGLFCIASFAIFLEQTKTKNKVRIYKCNQMENLVCLLPDGLLGLEGLRLSCLTATAATEAATTNPTRTIIY